MSGDVVSAAELEQMTPAEQQAVFDASVVADIDDVPADFLSRVRRRLVDHIHSSESPADHR